MPLAHTPRKQTVTEVNSPVDKETAGPSPKTTPTANVRKSIGEWETSKGRDPKTAASATYLVSPRKQVQIPVAPSKVALKTTLPLAGKETKRRSSMEAASASQKPVASADRVTEGRTWLQRAKTQLGESRNLKSEIKAGITLAVESMYRLIKDAAMEMEALKPIPCQQRKEGQLSLNKETVSNSEKTMREDTSLLIEKIDTHSKLLEENSRQMEELKKTLAEQKSLTETPSYARVAAAGSIDGAFDKRNTLHSVVVTSKDEKETGEQVLERVRKAIEAKEGWVKVERVRKAKNRKVVMGFESEGERNKVKERLEGSGIDLIVEAVKNRDPMVILRDVLAINSDEDVIKALRNQNRDVFRGLSDGEDRLEVRYRRKTRNPHIVHVVLSASPEVWQRVTKRGYAHIDLQRVRVEDQTPLMQCTRCLGYGHGRKHCMEKEDSCSHCGGPHLKTECPDWMAGGTAVCRNCERANLYNKEHNAFSTECPVRRKWDAIARSTTAYC
ncbi:hypothetical protein PYW08_004766 [Mythimna loreyi]|uniref:Uncharacterized protein n=1 Tax=Mythimna loreyi TaxID=667449 RepID=A0ACC2QQW6_9NEOP|nr:hypothetical protein PYW08_004766 [Mythimna loreyi]